MAGEYLLTAYNEPSSLTVHRINRDGTLGDRVKQPNPLDTGKYAHQIRATPDNRNVILITRGNNAPGDNPVNPGSIKTFSFKDGVLTNSRRSSPATACISGRVISTSTRPSPGSMCRSRARTSCTSIGATRPPGSSREPMFIKETLADPKSPVRQGAGTIHLHPNGRTLYVANRASATVEFEGKKVFAGGENGIAVFAIDPSTGEPTLVQSIDGRGITLRTFALDPSARMLVAASQDRAPGARRRHGQDASRRPVGLPDRRRRQARLRPQIRCGRRRQEPVLERRGGAGVSNAPCRSGGQLHRKQSAGDS